MYIEADYARLNTTRSLTGSQTDIPQLLCPPNTTSTLILGSGIGAVALGLATRHTDMQITCVDTSRESMRILAAVMYEYRSRVVPVVQDAETYVRQCSVQFDFVVVDLFDGKKICDFIASSTFIGYLLDLTTPTGVIIINTLGVPFHLLDHITDCWIDDYRVIADTAWRQNSALQAAVVPHLLNQSLLITNSKLPQAAATPEIGPVVVPLIPHEIPTIVSTLNSFERYRDTVRKGKLAVAQTENDFQGETTLDNLLHQRLYGLIEHNRLYETFMHDRKLATVYGAYFHDLCAQVLSVPDVWYRQEILDQLPACQERELLLWHLASGTRAAHRME